MREAILDVLKSSDKALDIYELQDVLGVVSVDDTSVQIIQIGGGETAAVQLNHRTDIRRNDRNDFQDHPLRTVA